VSKKIFEKTPLYQRLIALILIIALSPLLIFIAFLSFFDTGKNPIFIQERGLTLQKYRFKLFKFRTIKSSASEEYISNNPQILKKTFLYSKISTPGKYLRKTGLDELPQLFNILFGQMNFIGPRALSIEDLTRIKSEYPELYERRNQIKTKPGIIGLWQVNKDISCSIPHLIKLDEEYERHKSFLMDLKILFRAVEIILFGYHIDTIVNGEKIKIYPIAIYATLISTILLIVFVLNILRF